MFERKRAFGTYYPKAMTDDEIEKILNQSSNSDVTPVKRVTYDIYIKRL